jgi:hypothetical protein
MGVSLLWNRHARGGGGYIEKVLKRAVGVLDTPHQNFRHWLGLVADGFVGWSTQDGEICGQGRARDGE